MWGVPCPKVGQHACTVTQTLQIKGETTFVTLHGKTGKKVMTRARYFNILGKRKFL